MTMTPSPITCRAFIDDFARGMDEMVEMPLADARKRYEQLCQQLGAPLAEGVTTHENHVEIAGRATPLRLRHFIPEVARKAEGNLPAPVVFLHGGAWQIGSPESHQGIASSLAAQLGREVVSVDYRLLPEANYQDALADCLATIEHLSATVEPVAIVGDSAGARLAMDVARRLDTEMPNIGLQGTRMQSLGTHGVEMETAHHQEHPAPDKPTRYVLGLIYPPMDPVFVLAKENEFTLGSDAPLLGREEVVSMWLTVAEGDRSASYSPSPAHSQQPPARQIEVLAAEHDPLTQPLEAALDVWRWRGADVGYRCARGMVHAALHAHHALPEMQHAWRAFCEALDRRLCDLD